MSILVTGCYGFLGHAACIRLLEEGYEVVGVDKIQDAISPKAARIENLGRYDRFRFRELNLAHFGATKTLIEETRPEAVVHFAGQYSVKHSTETTRRYIEANLVGYTNLIEWAFRFQVPKFIYASSTHVETDCLPKSMYGATKEFGERCGNVYARLGMTFVALRFASVYGPYCREDTGIVQMAKKMLNGGSIDIGNESFGYKYGFVFVDDAVEVVVRCIEQTLPHSYNLATVIADDTLKDLHDVLECLEKASGMIAKKHGTPTERQGLAVPQAQLILMAQMIDYIPSTKMEEGTVKFWEWAKECLKN